MSGMDFLAWRVSFQSDEQALRAAFDQIGALTDQLARAKTQLQAIANAPRSNFEDSVEYQDWAASRAATTFSEIATREPVKGITRGPAACLCCKSRMGEPHAPDCYFAPFVTGTPP